MFFVFVFELHICFDANGRFYIGLTEGTFKQRFTQHRLSFNHRQCANSTELSKHIWELKDKNKEHNIEWTIITSAPTHNNRTKRCNLCLEEKLHILRAKDMTLLNKRSEIVLKCRHENKYYLMNTEMTPG